MAAPLYTTAQAVRDALAVDATVLDDARAGRLILTAEDAIDSALGYRPVDPDTGRKVAEADIESWQWERLARATTDLAALLFRQPELAGAQRYEEVWGPDFRFKRPLGSAAPAIATTIAGLGLTRRWGRATR